MKEINEVKILVSGDAMLDRYWFGDANRISPEAPVPVVKILKQEDRLGGAANVALNIATLGAQVEFLSVVGRDEPGLIIERILRERGIEPHLVTDLKIKTTVKQRIVARHQQVLRVDFEDRPASSVLSNHLKNYEALIKDRDVIVFSDYGKGGLDHVALLIKYARHLSIPVLIDPKGSNYEKYRGATVITPNKLELSQVVGVWRNEKELSQKAQTLRKDLDLEAILLTRSEEGMTLYTAQGEKSIPTQALEVFDVSGAGDTVIAVLATMMAMGMPLINAMTVANRAAGIVVGKLGTATVDFNELFPRGVKW